MNALVVFVVHKRLLSGHMKGLLEPVLVRIPKLVLLAVRIPKLVLLAVHTPGLVLAVHSPKLHTPALLQAEMVLHTPTLVQAEMVLHTPTLVVPQGQSELDHIPEVALRLVADHTPGESRIQTTPSDYSARTVVVRIQTTVVVHIH